MFTELVRMYTAVKWNNIVAFFKCDITVIYISFL